MKKKEAKATQIVNFVKQQPKKKSKFTPEFYEQLLNL